MFCQIFISPQVKQSVKYPEFFWADRLHLGVAPPPFHHHVWQKFLNLVPSDALKMHSLALPVLRFFVKHFLNYVNWITKHSSPWMFKKNLQIKSLYDYTFASEAVKQSVWKDDLFTCYLNEWKHFCRQSLLSIQHLLFIFCLPSHFNFFNIFLCWIATEKKEVKTFFGHQSLGTQTSTPGSQTAWIRHWQCTIITYKHGIYKLSHELPNDLRLRILEN